MSTFYTKDAYCRRKAYQFWVKLNGLPSALECWRMAERCWENNVPLFE